MAILVLGGTRSGLKIIMRAAKLNMYLRFSPRILTGTSRQLNKKEHAQRS